MNSANSPEQPVKMYNCIIFVKKTDMATIRVNTQDLNAEFIDNLKMRFPASDLAIVIGESEQTSAFAEADFWRVIE
jgi:hypothetical protein